MRTTINLDEQLVQRLMKETGIRRKTDLLHKALEALDRRCAQNAVLKLAGTQPGALEEFYSHQGGSLGDRHR